MRHLYIFWIFFLVTQPPAALAACSVERAVKKIVAEEYGKTPSQVSSGDRFAIDGPHTIEDTEIQQMIEEKFQIKIPETEWRELSSVDDLAKYLKEHSTICQ